VSAGVEKRPGHRCPGRTHNAHTPFAKLREDLVVETGLPDERNPHSASPLRSLFLERQDPFPQLKECILLFGERLPTKQAAW
jgi:hypothetical protein